jgi:hypothetical protein
VGFTVGCREEVQERKCCDKRQYNNNNNNNNSAGTRDRSTINNDRIAATIHPLGTWFVSGICVWIPCIKEKRTTTTMMMMMMMVIIITIIIIIIITVNTNRPDTKQSKKHI